MRKTRADYYAKRDSAEWTNWSRWDCPVTCGGGDAERIRQCLGPGVCEGPRIERKKCAEMPCPRGAPQFLIDQARQQIETDSKSYQLQEDDELTLNCLGNLRDTIYAYFRTAKAVWYHNRERFHPYGDGRIGVLDVTYNLFFAKTRAKDNGVWACKVQLSEETFLYTSVYTIAVESAKPDVEVKAGDPLTLRCHNMGLSVFFNSKMATQWYHNSTLDREFNDANPEDVAELAIREARTSDSGVWMCRVSEIDDRLRRRPLQWSTSVVRVRVEGSSALANLATDLKSSSTAVIGGIVVVIVVVVVVVGLGLFYCLKIRKKKQKDVEKGKSKKGKKERSRDSDFEFTGMSKSKKGKKGGKGKDSDDEFPEFSKSKKGKKGKDKDLKAPGFLKGKKEKKGGKNKDKDLQIQDSSKKKKKDKKKAKK